MLLVNVTLVCEDERKNWPYDNGHLFEASGRNNFRKEDILDTNCDILFI